MEKKLTRRESRETAFLTAIKEGRQSRYKTTCLLIILMLFSVFRQFGKLELFKLFKY